MELTFIIVLLALGWFWLDSLSKRERAINLGRELANKFNLQLLDETVSMKEISLGRNTRGHMQLKRTYHFEVSTHGADRMQCHLTLLGTQLEDWHIPPYLQAF